MPNQPPKSEALTFARSTLLAFVAAACSGGGGTGRILFVDASIPAPGAGTSWESAFRDMQSALAAAQQGDEIWVAQGVYAPAPSGGPRTATFRLVDGVAIYGGFAGGETSLAERDVLAHETVLSGDLDGDDGPAFSGMAENSHQVVVALNVGAATILDGFTIRGGRADGPGLGAVPESLDQGAGLNVYFASPRIANCTFTNNWNVNHGAVNDHGDESVFHACTFRGNHSARFGAGLYVHHHSMTTALECTFIDNEAAAEGGGAYSRSLHGATFSHCTFQGNRATLGAGMYHAAGSATHVIDCTFTDNEAAIGGGASYADEASPMFEDCTFEANTAGLGVSGGGGGDGGSGGGGIWANGGSPVVMGCTFRENEASFGGGTYFILGCDATVIDCLFEDNHANEAGGLYTLNSDVRVEGCAFARNSAAGSDFSVGGAVSNYYSDSLVTGCTFTDNRAELGGGGLYNEGENPVVRDSVFRGNSAFGAIEGWGGAILNGFFTRARIANCTFAGNTANLGGGVFHLVFSAPWVQDCTFAGNVAPAGPEMYSFASSTPVVRNSILWGPDASPLGGIAVDVSWSCVRGGHAGAGNVDVDPGFVRAPDPGADGQWGTADDDGGDLRLLPGSPCIDSGNSGEVPGPLTTDLDGNPRFQDDLAAPDTGVGPPPIVDMGAYERPGSP